MENYVVKIGMCDDDIENLKVVAKLLESELIEQNFNAEITIITNNQKDIYDAILRRDIDILFLDIDFKNYGKNGLDFANSLRNINKEFILVFLSAYQRYMHISFFVKVFDYLVKPLNKENAENIVIRLKDEFDNNYTKFFHLNKWISIRTDDILYIERIGNKSIVHIKDDYYYTYLNLERLLMNLPKYFRKSHRSFIVNTKKIVSIDKKNKLAYFSKTIACPINSYFEL